ncbi:hypothetical protein AVEN_173430-1 [Araneus ventricosus]|uniref:Uncharacterized protein n=1 Tax=Araneus ventricosus TaxID=182803 RepID=A0A4Y2QSP3_ARAVE|nr:hypothetical protein AVEN_173430-1 [Araneus ventricosus]
MCFLYWLHISTCVATYLNGLHDELLFGFAVSSFFPIAIQYSINSKVLFGTVNYPVSKVDAFLKGVHKPEENHGQFDNFEHCDSHLSATGVCFNLSTDIPMQMFYGFLHKFRRRHGGSFWCISSSDTSLCFVTSIRSVYGGVDAWRFLLRIQRIPPQISSSLRIESKESFHRSNFVSSPNTHSPFQSCALTWKTTSLICFLLSLLSE